MMFEDLLVVVFTYLEIPDIYRNVCAVSKKFRLCAEKAICSYEFLMDRRNFLEDLWDYYVGDVDTFYLQLLNKPMYLNKFYRDMYSKFSDFVSYCDRMFKIDRYLYVYYKNNELTEKGEKLCSKIFNKFSTNGLMTFDDISKLNRFAGVEFNTKTYNWITERYETLDGSLTYKGYRDMFIDNFDRVPTLMYKDLKKIQGSFEVQKKINNKC